jgi:hypothetical protein
MQAPIILSSTGAVARYPMARGPKFATRLQTFGDFSSQSFAQLTNPLGAWILNLSVLRDDEAQDWMEFFETQKGQGTIFTFADPWDNLLTNTEEFENAAWTKNSAFIGKNYLIHSEQFDDASWAKVGTGVAAPTVTPNATPGPDSNTVNTAEQIDFPATGAGQESRIEQSAFSVLPVVSSSPFTYSIFLRAGSVISVEISIFDGSTFVGTLTAVLATAWQRFVVSATAGGGASNLKVSVRNLASQSAKTIFAWGAQLEYGTGAASDYTKTVATTTELLIADPFWLAAPSNVPGSNFGLNSALPKRGRQFVANGFGCSLAQFMPLLPCGSGSSRATGLPLALSGWFKRQSSTVPSGVTLEVDDQDLLEQFGNGASFAPGASWARVTTLAKFSASNPSQQIMAVMRSNTLGTFYVFGMQAELGNAVSRYKHNIAVGGIHPKCRFSADQASHSVDGYDLNSLTQLNIQEYN